MYEHFGLYQYIHDTEHDNITQHEITCTFINERNNRTQYTCTIERYISAYATHTMMKPVVEKRRANIHA